jgi:hypothetical protein
MQVTHPMWNGLRLGTLTHLHVHCGHSHTVCCDQKSEEEGLGANHFRSRSQAVAPAGIVNVFQRIHLQEETETRKNQTHLIAHQ